MTTTAKRAVWKAAPRAPVLEDGEVHVWRASLARPFASLGRLREAVSEDELARGARYAFDRDRGRFLVTRAVLRSVLARYLETSPSALEFTYGVRGKPALTGRCGRAALTFNVSRSHDLALLAVARSDHVGVDLERIRRVADSDLIAGGSFAPAENAVLRLLPPADRRRAFFACWTRKEAYLKAIGEGLGFPTQAFAVTVDPNEPARLLQVDGDPEAPLRWTLCELRPATGYLGALAVEEPEAAVRTWSWEQTRVG